MMHSEVASRLQDAVHDAHKGSYLYGYYMNHDGDGESGNCIYSSGDDVMSAPYTIGKVGGKAAAHIDHESAKKVVPHLEYHEVADDDDHYATMEAQRLYADLDAAKLRETIPVYERFISKGERDAADEGSFAGKGKSYPILKPADVKAAVHAMGRAGPGNYGMAQLKANISRIAKKKGWTNELPKEWRGEGSRESADMGTADLQEAAATKCMKASRVADAATEAAHSATEAAKEEKTSSAYKKAGAAHQAAASAHYTASALHYGDGHQTIGRAHQEAAIHHQAKASQLNENGFANATESAGSAGVGDLILTESAATVETIVLQESRADYEIKLIAPGPGSCAFYTPEVLKRDGPKVFTKETKVFLNHQTDAEEAARPEGRVEDLAGVLTTDAQYHESHAKGPGLYARMKVFADHAKQVEEKAAHLGMSIRASGSALKEGGRVVTREGLPVLGALLARKSVDVVTEPGAGGMILTESAGSAAGQEATEMTAQEQAELKTLREANQANALELRRLREHESVRQASAELAKYFDPSQGGVRVGEAIKSRVIGRLTMDGQTPLKPDGTLDVPKLQEAAKRETESELAYLKSINPSLVQGMGATPAAAATTLTEADKAAVELRTKEANKALGKQLARTFGLPQNAKMGRKILVEGRRAFNYEYNALDHGAKLTKPEGAFQEA